MAAANHHCAIVELDGNGILIEGPPGAGKTSLALGTIDAALRAGLTGVMVADDQARLFRLGNELVACPIAPIAGRAELRGFGIIRVEYKPETTLRLVVRLVDDEAIERMPLPRRATLFGVDLPFLELPGRHEAQAVRIVMAWLTGTGPLR